MSLLIFTSIAARLPTQGQRHLPGDVGGVVSAVMLLGLAIVVFVVFVEQAQRRIPVQYAKRMVGRRMYGGTSTYIPLKVNQAGVIPVIFAVAAAAAAAADPGLVEQDLPDIEQSYFQQGNHPLYLRAYFR